VTVPVVRFRELGRSGVVVVSVNVVGGNPERFHEHQRPGQWVEVRGRAGGVARMTIASAPLNAAGCFELVCVKGDDPAGLAQLRFGDDLEVGPVQGEGLTVSRASNVRLVADCVDGVAAIRSYTEWKQFQIGCRGVSVTAFLGNPQGNTPWSRDLLQGWLSPSVQVISLSGNNWIQGLPGLPSDSSNTPMDTSLVICMASQDLADIVQSKLDALNQVRITCQRLTREDMFGPTVEHTPFPKTTNFGPKSEVRDDYAVSDEDLEQEVWRIWTSFRERMASDLEERHTTKPAWEETSSSYDWDEWFRQNRDKWTEIRWDDSVWGTYWDQWADDQERWQGPGFDPEGRTSSSYNWSYTGSRFTGSYEWSSWGWEEPNQGPKKKAVEIDFYRILGVDPSANYSEIKRAYRVLAKKFHPDRNRSNEKEAAEKMKDIALAYTILKEQLKHRR